MRKRFVSFKVMQKFFKRYEGSKTGSTVRLQIGSCIHPWLKIDAPILLKEVHNTTRSYTHKSIMAKIWGIEKNLYFNELAKETQKHLIDCYGDKLKLKKSLFYKIYFEFIGGKKR